MRIRRATIKNIQAIKEIVWHPPKDAEVGWHVILGDNGSGKTSFLRAISLALLGPQEALAARQDWGTWVRWNTKQGSISLEILADSEYDTYSNGKVEEKPINLGQVEYEARLNFA